MYIKRKLLTLLVCSFAAVFCMNYHTGPGGSGFLRTGAPFDGGTCATCHSGGSFSPTTTVQVLNGTTPVTAYVPGASYTVRVTVAGGPNFGFQIVCVNASNTDYNGWGAVPPNTHIFVGGTRHYIEHTAILTSGFVDIPWTAPLSGQVKFYACGNVVNANGSSGGDNPAATTLFLNPCVAPGVTPTVTNVTCFGNNTGAVSLTVSGTGPFTYSWAGPSGFTSTNQNIAGLTAGTYSVSVSASGCTANTTATVTQPSSAVSALASSNAPFCPGSDTLKFVGTGSGGTGTLTYSWTGPLGFTSAAQFPQILNPTPAINGVYSLTVTDANGCTANASTTVAIYPLPIVYLGPDAAICSGSPVSLDAGNIGSTYLWNTSATTQTITTTTPGVYWATATNSFGCSSSDTINITTSGTLVPSVTITAADTTICATRLATFTATPVNGGTSPTYQWRKNGVAVGSIGPTYSSTTINNGDRITARLTSSFSCASPTQVFSDTIHMIVNPMFTPYVSITHLPDTACTGTPTTFTANPINGGTTPFYQWKKAGVPVGTGSTYTYSPTVSETITVDMASSLTCHSIDTVTNSTSFVIYPALTPIITISTPATSDSIAYAGEIFTFNSTVTYGGLNPRFQWYMNRVAITGATTNTFSPHIYTNDTVVCVVTSDAVCAIPNKDTSNKIIIYGSFLGVNDINANRSAISVYPNPTSGDFTLKGLVGLKANEEVLIEVRDLKGTIVYRKFISAPSGQLNESLSLGNQLAEGMYLLRVHTDLTDKLTKLIIKK